MRRFWRSRSSAAIPTQWLFRAMRGGAEAGTFGIDDFACSAMHIVHHAHLKQLRSGGEQRFAAADRSLGVQAFEVWMRRLEPGAHSVEKQHDGELVVLVLSGCGKLLIDGGPQRLAAPCTVLVPPHRPFQFVNHGSEPMQMVAVCTARPVPLDN